MKVKCKKIIDLNGNQVEHSKWLKLGGTYHVLSIWISAQKVSLRLIGEDSCPALFEMEMFEVIGSHIPSSWIVNVPAEGCLQFGPAVWAKPGFWEKFFENEQESLECFKSECKRIYEEES